MKKKRSLSQLAQHWKTLQRPSWFTKRLPEHLCIHVFLSTLINVILLSGSSVSFAANDQTRIAIAIDPEGQSCVLGGGVNGTLQSAGLISKLLKPQQDFRLYNLRGRQSTVLWPIGPPKKIENNTCNPHFRQQLSLMVSEIGEAQVAIFDSDGNKLVAVLPKVLEIMNTDNEKYSKVLATFLNGQKLGDAPVKIKQLIRTDLEGDGNYEVIINAINTERGQDRKGEYSIVLIVRDVGGKQVIEAIQNEITLEDSDLPAALWENTIAAIADVNGDGKMEIMMFGQFYHGQGWDLITDKNFSAERPIICGCGG
jgi:hypothetical protein